MQNNKQAGSKSTKFVTAITWSSSAPAVWRDPLAQDPVVALNLVDGASNWGSKIELDDEQAEVRVRPRFRRETDF